MDRFDRDPVLPLAGYRLLVVEDDYLAAHDLSATLREQGAIVLGPAPSMASARSLASALRPDCVLLDLNLDGEYAFSLAQELTSRGIYTVFTTGYDASILPAQLRDIPCVQKPLNSSLLVRIISNRAGTGRDQQL